MTINVFLFIGCLFACVIAGFFVAAICAASGRASSDERYVLRIRALEQQLEVKNRSFGEKDCQELEARLKGKEARDA